MALYNNKLLQYQMERLKTTPDQVAEKASVSKPSVYTALAGDMGTLAPLRRISDALLIKWKYITHVELPESQFRRAVESGAMKKGG